MLRTPSLALVALLIACGAAACGGSASHSSGSTTASAASASPSTFSASTTSHQSPGAGNPGQPAPTGSSGSNTPSPPVRRPGVRRLRILFSPGRRTPLSTNFTYAVAAYLVGVDEPLHFFRLPSRIPTLLVKRVQGGLRISVRYLTLAAREAKSDAAASGFAGAMNQLAGRLSTLRSNVGRRQYSLAQVQSLQNAFVSIYTGLRGHGFSLGEEPKGAHLPR